MMRLGQLGHRRVIMRRSMRLCSSNTNTTTTTARCEEEEVSTSSGRMTGVVKSWGLKSGRIALNDDKEAVVFQKHIQADHRPKYRSLFEGSTVEFELEKMSEDNDTLMATQITMLGGEKVPRYRSYNSRGHFGLRQIWRNSVDGEPKNSKKKRNIGQVMSIKNNKTAMVKVVVEVKPHAKYGKYLVRRKTYACHDPQSKCRFGDVVEIETVDKNITKTKAHKVVGVIREENYIDRDEPNRLVTRDEDFA